MIFFFFERLGHMHENKTFFLFYNFLQCFDEKQVFQYRICKPILSKVDKTLWEITHFERIFFCKFFLDWAAPGLTILVLFGVVWPSKQCSDKEDEEEREANL